MDRLKQFVTSQKPIEFLKYILASALALVIDYGCYWLLVTNQLLDLPKSAVVGYIVGLVVAYFLIAGKVFKDGWMKDQKRIEAFMFLLSGLLGIALTYLTVKVVTLLLGDRINLAKICAVGVSFIGVYIARKNFVFRKKSFFKMKITYYTLFWLIVFAIYRQFDPAGIVFYQGIILAIPILLIYYFFHRSNENYRNEILIIFLLTYAINITIIHYYYC